MFLVEVLSSEAGAKFLPFHLDVSKWTNFQSFASLVWEEVEGVSTTMMNFEKMVLLMTRVQEVEVLVSRMEQEEVDVLVS